MVADFSKLKILQNFLVAFAAQDAIFAQLLGVVGIDGLPAQPPLQQVADALLDEDVFGVVVAHETTLLALESPQFFLIQKCWCTPHGFFSFARPKQNDYDRRYQLTVNNLTHHPRAQDSSCL